MTLKRGLIFSFILFIAACSSVQKPHHTQYDANDSGVYRGLASVGGFDYDPRRGSPSEYDSGPAKDSKWVELFGSVPNYRALGKKIMGGSGEKFRWIFGPMWYRGRLSENSVQVFVVGQEGAQDENVTNRAFTGSTGTRVQKFLNHLGIYRSYLFMNTFVYTIFGQLEPDNPKFAWMEQGETSPIVKYRHGLFDHMAETNSESLSLIMGVGSGGKNSVATWINSRGGKCAPDYDLQKCDTSGMVAWFKKNKGITLKNPILVIGVPHPGGANPNLGGEAALQNIIRGFTNAAKRVAAFKTENPKWLPSDEDEKLSPSDLLKRLNADFKYGHAPIPFRDFAFGTNWRMGSKGTSSNRWGQDSIQIFSDAGTYNDKSSKYAKVSDEDSGFTVDKKQLAGMKTTDVPYEPPKYYSNDRSHGQAYDYGPCGHFNSFSESCKIADALMDWPDFESLPAQGISHTSFGHGSIYRGQLDHAQILVLADQESNDDLFSGRALTGTNGQRFQKFLFTTGVNSNYAIIRTLPIDTLGMPESSVIELATDEAIVKTHQNIIENILAKNKTKVFLTLGPVAKALSEKLKVPSTIQKFHLDTPSTSSHVSKWNDIAKKVAQAIGSESKGSYDGKLMTIPRSDLPFHSRWWMGSSGTRSARGEGAEKGNYYRVTSPYWVTKLPSQPLTSSETKEVESAMKDMGF